MRVDDFSEMEIHVLRRALRGPGGPAAIGAVTVDPVSASRGVRADLKGSVMHAIEDLARKGILNRKPKPGTHVFSLAPQAVPGIRTILEQLAADKAQKAGPQRTADELEVEPTLLVDVLSSLEKEALVDLISYDTSASIDFQETDSGRTYRKLALVLEVMCPYTGEGWILKMEVGVLDRFELRQVPCSSCDRHHNFRGPNLIAPRR